MLPRSDEKRPNSELSFGAGGRLSTKNGVGKVQTRKKPLKKNSLFSWTNKSGLAKKAGGEESERENLLKECRGPTLGGRNIDKVGKVAENRIGRGSLLNHQKGSRAMSNAGQMLDWCSVSWSSRRARCWKREGKERRESPGLLI